jgi:hypothetical protein
MMGWSVYYFCSGVLAVRSLLKFSYHFLNGPYIFNYGFSGFFVFFLGFSLLKYTRKNMFILCSLISLAFLNFLSFGQIQTLSQAQELILYNGLLSIFKQCLRWVCISTNFLKPSTGVFLFFFIHKVWVVSLFNSKP